MGTSSNARILRPQKLQSSRGSLYALRNPSMNDSIMPSPAKMLRLEAERITCPEWMRRFST